MLITAVETQPAVGTDLLRNSVFRLSDEDREITGAFLGEAAAEGTATVRASLYVSDIVVADLIYGGQTPEGYQLFPVDAEVPGGSEIRCIITTGASGAVAVSLVLQVDQMDMEDDLEDLVYA